MGPFIGITLFVAAVATIQWGALWGAAALVLSVIVAGVLYVATDGWSE